MQLLSLAQQLNIVGVQGTEVIREMCRTWTQAEGPCHLTQKGEVMIYTALNMELPSHEDTYIPLFCEQLEEQREDYNAEITANVRGTQLVCFLTDADGVPIGKALGWPGDPDPDVR